MVTHTTLGQHIFKGPYTSTTNLLQNSGVYIISTLLADGTHQILDVGESSNIQARISNHDRVDSWGNHAINGVYVAVHYCDEFTRMLLERAIRLAYAPPCGEQ